MTRHQRRKLARQRAADKLERKAERARYLEARAFEILKAEIVKRNMLTDKGTFKRKPERSPKGMGNSPLWDGTRYLRGYGTGAFKDKPLGERALRELRAKDR